MQGRRTRPTGLSAQDARPNRGDVRDSDGHNDIVTLRPEHRGGTLDVRYDDEFTRLVCTFKGALGDIDTLCVFGNDGVALPRASCDARVGAKKAGVVHLSPGKPALVVLASPYDLPGRDVRVLKLLWNEN